MRRLYGRRDGRCNGRCNVRHDGRCNRRRNGHDVVDGAMDDAMDDRMEDGMYEMVDDAMDDAIEGVIIPSTVARGGGWEKEGRGRKEDERTNSKRRAPNPSSESFHGGFLPEQPPILLHHAWDGRYPQART